MQESISYVTLDIFLIPCYIKKYRIYIARNIGYLAVGPKIAIAKNIGGFKFDCLVQDCCTYNVYTGMDVSNFLCGGCSTDCQTAKFNSQPIFWLYSKYNNIIVCKLQGIAVNLDSSAFKHLHAATGDVLGESQPYSITGSLPLVGDLQKEGFDVQICGYGHSSVYHGDNEYCSLSAMENAFKILCILIDKYNQ